MEITKEILDFYNIDEQELIPPEAKQSKDKPFSKEEFNKEQEKQIANSNDYVKIVFHKPKGLFTKFEGKSIVYIKKGRKFGSAERPFVKKFRKIFAGWMYKDSIINDTYIVNEPLELIPVFN